MSKKIIFTDRSNELLNSYLKDISKYKILESSEIAKLILEAHEGNHKVEIIDNILMANVSLLNDSYQISYEPLYLDI